MSFGNVNMKDNNEPIQSHELCFLTQFGLCPTTIPPKKHELLALNYETNFHA